MKLIKDGDEFILEAHKNDIPKIVKVVGQAGRHPDWVIVASSGNNHPYLQLSLENCKVIMNVVDVEKLAEECAETAHTMDELYENGLFYGFVAGFDKAMELNKDKLFTIPEVIKLCTCYYKIGLVEASMPSEIRAILPKEIIEDLKLLIPTEIEVEFEMEIADLAFYENGKRYPIEANIPERFKYKPKLDSQGHLILKKI